MSRNDNITETSENSRTYLSEIERFDNQTSIPRIMKSIRLNFILNQTQNPDISL